MVELSSTTTATLMLRRSPLDLVALLPGLQPDLPGTTLRPCSRIASAMRVLTGRVTMLGIARWAGPGGSYRTVPRFFSTVMPWATRLWGFFRQHVSRPAEVDLRAGEAVVVTKAGTPTEGLDRCFSRLDGTPVPGRSVFTVALVRTQERRAVPRRVQPRVRSEAAPVASTAHAPAQPQQPSSATRRPGRPPGRQTTPKAEGTLTPERGRSAGPLEALLTRGAGSLPWTSWVLDGHVGHHHALPRARPGHVPRMSTRRGAAARYCPSTGPAAGRGPRRQEGRTREDHPSPAPDRQETTGEGTIQTGVYQAQRLPKACAHAWPVGSIVQTTLHTHTRGHVLRCSRALERTDDTRRDD
jgi:putative transposase